MNIETDDMLKGPEIRIRDGYISAATSFPEGFVIRVGDNSASFIEGLNVNSDKCFDFIDKKYKIIKIVRIRESKKLYIFTGEEKISHEAVSSYTCGSEYSFYKKINRVLDNAEREYKLFLLYNKSYKYLFKYEKDSKTMKTVICI